MNLTGGKKTIIADLSLMLVALFWGLGFVAMKDALDSFSPFWLLTIRFFSGTALMTLIFKKRLARLTRADLKAGALIGIFLFLGFAGGIIGQLGDLCESAIKRNYGKKDASSLLPGHGGLMDRMDTLIFLGPFVYYYRIFVIG